MSQSRVCLKLSEFTSMADDDNLKYCVHNILTPLIRCLKVFGFYHDQDHKYGINANPEMRRDTKVLKAMRSTFQRTYCIVVVVMVWLNTLRYMPSFWVGFNYKADLTVPRVIRQVWMLQCALTTTILIWNCRKRTWEIFYDHWYAIIIIGSHLNFLDDKIKKMRRLCSIILAGSLVYYILQITLEALVAYKIGNAVVYANPFPSSMPYSVVFIILDAWMMAVWLFSAIFIIAICGCIKIAFGIVTECLSNSLSKTQGYPENMKKIRTIHLKLCRLTEHLDGPFKILIFSMIGSYVFISCFTLYDLIVHDCNILNKVLNYSWLITNITTLAVVIVFIANVNAAAHSPLSCIYDIQTEDLTTQQLGQLTLFLSKLTGTSIGFTAMGFFTITKEVILTIGGLYLTYFFLLLQFKIN